MSALALSRPGRRRLAPLALAALAAAAIACGGDSAGVAEQSAVPADSIVIIGDTLGPETPDSAAPRVPADSGITGTPADTGIAAPADTSGMPADSAPGSAPKGEDASSPPAIETLATQAGIVFGTNGLDASLLSSVHTGTLRGGGVTEQNVGTLLADVKAKGGRIVLKLCNGSDSYVKNSDGTFSLTKWKSLVARFKNSNLGPYISDGTIVGHYLIDEPQRTQRWGGKEISRATLEEMARYSKGIWPTMATFVRAVPSWLAAGSQNYSALDAGWAQYTAGKGTVNDYIGSEVAAAKKKGLGLAVGLNVLDGGDGSSRIAGFTRGKYAMSASEIRTYGTALLNQSYACAFYNWMYDASYYGRSDIKSAMADMSAKARNHGQTSCKQ
jgi:hypothetical protein